MTNGASMPGQLDSEPIRTLRNDVLELLAVAGSEANRWFLLHAFPREQQLPVLEIVREACDWGELNESTGGALEFSVQVDGPLRWSAPTSPSFNAAAGRRVTKAVQSENLRPARLATATIPGGLLGA